MSVKSICDKIKEFEDIQCDGNKWNFTYSTSFDERWNLTMENYAEFPYSYKSHIHFAEPKLFGKKNKLMVSIGKRINSQTIKWSNIKEIEVDFVKFDFIKVDGQIYDLIRKTQYDVDGIYYDEDNDNFIRIIGTRKQYDNLYLKEGQVASPLNVVPKYLENYNTIIRANGSCAPVAISTLTGIEVNVIDEVLKVNGYRVNNQGTKSGYTNIFPLLGFKAIDITDRKSKWLELKYLIRDRTIIKFDKKYLVTAYRKGRRGREGHAIAIINGKIRDWSNVGTDFKVMYLHQIEKI